MFRTLRQTLIATTVAASTVGLAGTGNAGGGEPVQRLGRLLGVGWGDGYHSCADSGLRPGANMPPRSYHKQFDHRSIGESIVCQGDVSSGNFYDQFDSISRCQTGGCNPNCGQQPSIQLEQPVPEQTYPEPEPIDAPMELPPADPESASDVEAGLTSDSVVRLAAELAESQKRPIRPLPPQTRREINIPDPVVRPDLPRPIRPLPPMPKLQQDSGTPGLTSMDARVGPRSSGAATFQKPTEQQILNQAINDIVIPGFAKPDRTIRPDNPGAAAKAVDRAAKPVVELVPRVATVPDWMVVRQPR